MFNATHVTMHTALSPAQSPVKAPAHDSSVFTLAKTLRDAHEGTLAQRLHEAA